jgi:hypothetical protein
MENKMKEEIGSKVDDEGRRHSRMKEVKVLK